MKNPLNKILAEISYYNGRYLLPPKYICFNLTYQCNFSCLSCDIWRAKKKNELAVSDWIEIIRELKNILPAKTAIEISGGEPLLEKEKLIRLIQEIKKYFSYVSINSNGSLLNKKNLKKLKRAGLDAIKLSFYSLKPKIHNQLKGNPRAFEHALKAIKLIPKFDLNLSVGILITSKNIAGIPDLIKFLSPKPHTEIILQPLDEVILSSQSKKLNKNYLPNALWPKKIEVKKLFRFLEKNRGLVKNRDLHLEEIKKYYLSPEKILKSPCFVGQNSLVVNPDGEIKFCFKHHSLGNIKKDSIVRIIKSGATAQKRKNIKHCRKLCRVLGCNYSPSLAAILKHYCR